MDTGATNTMVSSNVVVFIGLQPVNKIMYAGLGGLVARNPGNLSVKRDGSFSFTW